MWYVIILIIAALILIYILCSYVFVEFSFTSKQRSEALNVDVKALAGLFKYRYSMPYFIYKGFDEGVLVKKEVINQNKDQLVDEERESITKSKIESAYEKAKMFLKRVVGFSQWMTKTLSRVHCIKLQWKTNVGTGDAAETAIIIGALWAIKSTLMTFAMKFVRFDAMPVLAANPQYNKTIFSMELKCKVKIRVIFICISGFQLLYRMMKMKAGTKSWKWIVLRP